MARVPIRRREHLEYAGVDSALYNLTAPAQAAGRWVLSVQGTGLPPIEQVTSRAPGQHGDTVQAQYLGPRVVLVHLRQNFCSREEYWDGRAGLLAALHPLRQLVAGAASPGTLRFTLADGSRRYLACYLTEGPQFAPSQVGRWDEWAFTEVLRFVAHDPTFWDPSLRTVTWLPATALVFPITFPITFGAFGVDQTITYPGTWRAYPTLTITGPADAPILTNVTTGERIACAYNVPAGRQLIITLTEASKSVADDLGMQLLGTVTPESDLATWHIAPAPEAAGGVNVLRVTAGGVGAASRAVLTYYDRYVAI